MADHGHETFFRAPAMHVAVATAHRAESRSHIGAGAIEERFSKGQPPGLIANERRKNVSFSQRHAGGGAQRFLALAQKHAPGDLPASVERGNLLFCDPCEKHPAVGGQEIGFKIEYVGTGG